MKALHQVLLVVNLVLLQLVALAILPVVQVALLVVPAQVALLAIAMVALVVVTNLAEEALAEVEDLLPQLPMELPMNSLLTQAKLVALILPQATMNPLS